MRLSHNDWEQVSVFLQKLYAQTEAGAFRQTALDGLLKLIPSEHASYNEIDSRTNAAVLLMRPWVPEIFILAPQLETHLSEHPQLGYYRQSADRLAYQTTDFISLREFHQKGLYQDVYRHLDTEHQLACLLSDFGSAEDVGIALNRKLKKFSERDRAVLNHLRPHLVRARQNAAAISRAENQVQALTSTLDAVQAGLALVDHSGRVTWATPRVRQWLELYFPDSRNHPDRLPADMERWLQAQLGTLNQGTALTKAPAALVAHNQHSTLMVRFHSVQGATRLIFSEKCELLPAHRAREFGLTEREAEILHWTSEGKNSPEISLLLHISPRTVHKHMEHIFAKLGVETRLAAVRQISAG